MRFESRYLTRLTGLPTRRLPSGADEEGNRKRVLHRFPYSVIYEVLGSTVTVLAMAHHRRKPGYWRSGGG